MYVTRFDDGIRIFAPAKLNLFLEVLGKRADGFHDIETLATAINIYDTLELRPLDSGDIDLSCQWSRGWNARSNGSRRSLPNAVIWSDLPDPSHNLAHRALERLKQAAGIDRGMSIRLVKNIPAEAGMGGASSDAAAALVGANLIWDLGWSSERLARLGAELGSDIPFFFAGGAAVCEGRGERVRRVDFARRHFVVVKPPVGLSTADVYGVCRPGSPPRSSTDLSRSLGSQSTAKGVAAALFNRLEFAARELTPWIDRVCGDLRQTGCLAARMTGSGTCCFGLCRTAREAHRAAARLRQKNIGGVFAAASCRGYANQHLGVA